MVSLKPKNNDRWPEVICRGGNIPGKEITIDLPVNQVQAANVLRRHVVEDRW